MPVLKALWFREKSGFHGMSNINVRICNSTRHSLVAFIKRIGGNLIQAAYYE